MQISLKGDFYLPGIRLQTVFKSVGRKIRIKYMLVKEELWAGP